MREYYLDIPSIIIGIIIYIIISKLTISDYLNNKDIILIFFLIEIFGLIYDGAIILLGFLMPDSVLIFFNRLRFILHGVLVPLLILFTAYALKSKEMYLYIHLGILIILSIIGMLAGIIAKLKIVEDAVLKRYTFDEEMGSLIMIIFNVMNIGSVLYMIVVGVFLLIKRKEYFFFLSGLFMLIFSAIGPAIGKIELNYLLSMYGEVLMVIFLYLFFKKNEEENLNLNQLDVKSEKII